MRCVKNRISQFLIFLLIVQTLNLSTTSFSIHTPENLPNTLDEKDYVDSMLEFVVENMLDFSKHTFHEKSIANNFPKQQQANFHVDLKWLPDHVQIFDVNIAANSIENVIPRNERFANLYFKEVPIKPPQLLFA